VIFIGRSGAPVVLVVAAQGAFAFGNLAALACLLLPVPEPRAAVTGDRDEGR
jgi:hypothetical protein